MQYMGCSRCGYCQHHSHGATFCPDCGQKLQPCTDSRDLGDSTRQEEYRKLLELKKKLGES